MFSLLIPIYNFDVRPLVSALLDQCRRELGSAFEILCFDDGSEAAFLEKNRELEAYPGVRYRELPENLGRARIRNLLAEEARYPYLLFMDNDSAPEDERFISRYRKMARPDAVIYGGRTYQPDPPADRDLFFHWFYGSKREVKSSEQRDHSPYQGFQTNNFLMPKDLFLSIRFDPQLLQYGHEDTLFGLELEKRGIPIVHIDNPLRHIGLEAVDVFLEKQKRAIENLFVLYNNKKPVETRLLTFYKKMRRWRMDVPFYLAWRLVQPLLERNFRSRNPNLLVFDLYRLGYLVKLQLQKKKGPSIPLE